MFVFRRNRATATRQKKSASSFIICSLTVFPSFRFVSFPLLYTTPILHFISFCSIPFLQSKLRINIQQKKKITINNKKEKLKQQINWKKPLFFVQPSSSCLSSSLSRLLQKNNQKTISTYYEDRTITIPAAMITAVIRVIHKC